MSWLSDYKTEKEILVARGCVFRVCPSQSIQIGKNQYIVLGVGDDSAPANSFQKMLLMQQSLRIPYEEFKLELRCICAVV